MDSTTSLPHKTLCLQCIAEALLDLSDFVVRFEDVGIGEDVVTDNIVGCQVLLPNILRSNSDLDIGLVILQPESGALTLEILLQAPSREDLRRSLLSFLCSVINHELEILGLGSVSDDLAARELLTSCW